MNKGSRQHVNTGGFTLIELMFSITILAILLGIGIPNFRGLIERHRLSSATNELIAALQLARSTAIRRNDVVSICPLQDAHTCGGTWSSGWMVFSGDESITEPPEVAVIRRNSGFPSSVALSSDLDAGTAMSYGSAGQIVSGASVEFTFSSNSDFRCISVPLSGKTTLSYESCEP